MYGKSECGGGGFQGGTGAIVAVHQFSASHLAAVRRAAYQKSLDTGGGGTSDGKLTAYVKGTPRHPELDLGKMVQEQVLQQGLQLLQGALKK